jgi:hypothetical protein
MNRLTAVPTNPAFLGTVNKTLRPLYTSALLKDALANY